MPTQQKKRTWYATDGNATIEITAKSAKQAAQEYVDTGDWGDRTSTIWIDVHCWRQTKAGRKIDEESHTVELDPQEPACIEAAHDWREMSLRGNGGGVICVDKCRHCNWQRTTDTWAQNPQTGEQGLASVSYCDGEDA